MALNPTPPTEAPDAEAASAAEAMLTRFVDSWNAANGLAYGEGYWDDAELVDPSGQISSGRNAIAQGHVNAWSGPFKGSQVRGRTRRIQRLGPDFLVGSTSVIGLVSEQTGHIGNALADHELLFRSNRGTRVSYDALHYQWAKLCQVAGLVDGTGGPRYTPHQLCHTRGSELIAQGQRVEVVQRVLGHRDIRSTLGYAELQDAQVRAAPEWGSSSQ